MEKISNEQKYINYRKRKVLRIVIMLLSIFTIILAILSLFKVINMIWAIILFVVVHCITKYRQSIVINERSPQKSEKKKKK